MCGILGILSKPGTIKKRKMFSALETIRHRGPDGSNIWINDSHSVALGHVRLSILDLSSGGAQPMQSSEGRYIITFNGEIYNYSEIREKLCKKGYQFNSTSDTEVLLNSFIEWREDCLKHLSGMFVFAVHDQHNGKLFIARDRAGEKPLYYLKYKDSFIFASELKAILSISEYKPEIDLCAFGRLLNEGYTGNEQSVLKGVKKLPAGTYISICQRTTDFRLEKYWEIPNYIPSASNADDLVCELEDKLKHSLKLQLHADVPVGVLLSGGLDSSIITALATQTTAEINTFNVAFPGYKKQDESQYARLVANYFSTKHHELEVPFADPYFISKMVEYFDEPMIDSSMIPTYLLASEIAKTCKVAIGGDGGDELFGGYIHYRRLAKAYPYLKKIPKPFTKNLHKLISQLPTGLKGKNYLNLMISLATEEKPIVNPLYYQNDFYSLFKDKGFILDLQKQDWSVGGEDIVQAMTRLDFSSYFCEDILVKIDRASMGNSLEMRAPFLDPNVIEFAFSSVPSELKATSKNQKILLKKLAKKILPPNLNINRKQGFSIPLNDWLNNKVFKQYFYDTLTSDDSIFDKFFIQKLFKAQDNGVQNGERIFALTLITEWINRYNVSIR